MRRCLNCYYFRFVGLYRFCSHSKHVHRLSNPWRRCIDWIRYDEKFHSSAIEKKVELEIMLDDNRH